MINMAEKAKSVKTSIWDQITNVKEMSREEYLKLVRRIGLFVIIGFAVSFAVFLGLALLGGVGKVIGIIASANPYWLGLAFLFQFLGYVLMYGKWRYLLHELKLKVPTKKSFLIYLSLYSMNITPGNIGRIVAAFSLTRITNIRFINVVPIVTMDIFTDFMGAGILALLTAIFVQKFVIYVIVIDVLLTLPFLLILNKSFFNLVKRLIKNGKSLRIFTLYGDEYYASQSILNKPKTYGVALAFTLPAAFLSAMSLFLAMHAIGLTPHLISSISISTTAQVFGMVTAVPGNIGVTDGTLVALLGSTFGLDTTVSSALTIMTRIVTLWFGIIMGAIALFYTMKYWAMRPSDSGKDEKRKRKKD